jgi:hypothetical protein
MNQNPVVSSVIKALNPEQTEQAKTAGSLFAHSELDADKAFESFARAITESPTFVMYEESRILWVSGYLDIKPQAKGNTADAAFKRFKDRLVEKYGIDIPKPKSDNPAAEKKRAERETKRAELVKAFENNGRTTFQRLSLLWHRIPIQRWLEPLLRISGQLSKKGQRTNKPT